MARSLGTLGGRGNPNGTSNAGQPHRGATAVTRQIASGTSSSRACETALAAHASPEIRRGQLHFDDSQLSNVEDLGALGCVCGELWAIRNQTATFIASFRKLGGRRQLLQNGWRSTSRAATMYFRLIWDLGQASRSRFRMDTSKSAIFYGRLRRRAFGGIHEIDGFLLNYRRRRDDEVV